MLTQLSIGTEEDRLEEKSITEVGALAIAANLQNLETLKTSIRTVEVR